MENKCLLGTTQVKSPLVLEKKYNLKRYQKELINEFTPTATIVKIRDTLKQTHVANKTYAVCKFQKNILENFHKWVGGTYFIIESVE